MYTTNHIRLQYPNVEDELEFISQLETAKGRDVMSVYIPLTHLNAHSNHIFCFLFTFA